MKILESSFKILSGKTSLYHIFIHLDPDQLIWINKDENIYKIPMFFWAKMDILGFLVEICLRIILNGQKGLRYRFVITG